MTDTKQPKQQLAEDLIRVLDGNLALAEVLAHPERYGGALEPCLQGLQHYLADEAVRAKDAGHRAMQEDAMERLIDLLLMGAPNEELASASFRPS